MPEEIPSPPLPPQPQEQQDQLQAQQPTVQPRRTSASQIDEFFDDDIAVDANLWAVDVEEAVIEAEQSETISNKSVWQRDSESNKEAWTAEQRGNKEAWTAEDLINDTSYSKGTATYVSPVSLRNIMDDEVFIKPEPVENRLAMWEDVTTSVRHLDPEESNNVQLSSSAPTNVGFLQPQPSIQQFQRTQQHFSCHQNYQPLPHNQEPNHQFMSPIPGYHPQNSSHGQDVKIEDPAHMQVNMQSSDITNLLTSPSPPLIRTSINSNSLSHSHYRYSQPNSQSIAAIHHNVVSSTHRMYTPPTPPSSDQGSPGDLHAHYPSHFPVTMRRTPPPPYTATTTTRTSQQHTVSTPVNSLSPGQRHTLPDFTANAALQHRLQPNVGAVTPPNTTTFLSHSNSSSSIPSDRVSYTQSVSIPSGSGATILPGRTSSNTPSSGASSSSIPPSSTHVPKYCRRNNPELEKRRIHHCDFPGKQTKLYSEFYCVLFIVKVLHFVKIIEIYL